jgi:hypothetical protein
VIGSISFGFGSGLGICVQALKTELAITASSERRDKFIDTLFYSRVGDFGWEVRGEAQGCWAEP